MFFFLFFLFLQVINIKVKTSEIGVTYRLELMHWTIVLLSSFSFLCRLHWWDLYDLTLRILREQLVNQTTTGMKWNVCILEGVISGTRQLGIGCICKTTFGCIYCTLQVTSSMTFGKVRAWTSAPTNLVVQQRIEQKWRQSSICFDGRGATSAFMEEV